MVGFLCGALDRARTYKRNDILRKHGIIPEKPPSPTAQIQEALQEAKILAHENRLEDKTLDELDELEDDEDEEFLAQYRSVIIEWDGQEIGLTDVQDTTSQ